MGQKGEEHFYSGIFINLRGIPAFLGIFISKHMTHLLDLEDASYLCLGCISECKLNNSLFLRKPHSFLGVCFVFVVTDFHTPEGSKSPNLHSKY